MPIWILILFHYRGKKIFISILWIKPSIMCLIYHSFLLAFHFVHSTRLLFFFFLNKYYNRLPRKYRYVRGITPALLCAGYLTIFRVKKSIATQRTLLKLLKICLAFPALLTKYSRYFVFFSKLQKKKLTYRWNLNHIPISPWRFRCVSFDDFDRKELFGLVWRASTLPRFCV